MKYLFLDNFRGFSNTSVPLADVNFLVGENSSGKTSLLTMLRTLSNPQSYMGAFFMRPGGPEGDDLQFGHFDEMVSAHSSDRTYFRLGFVDKQISHKREKTPSYIGTLLTYKEIDGLPKIVRSTFASGGLEVSLSFEGGDVSYRRKEVSPVTTAEEMNDRLLGWVRDYDEDRSSNWVDIGLPKGYPQELPLFILLSMAANHGTPKDSKPASLPFPQGRVPLVWIAPIRTKPRRTYDEPYTVFSPEGSHTPYVIRRMLGSQTEAEKFKDFIENIGRSSGLFEKIEIKHFGTKSDTSPFEVDAYIDGKAMSLNWLGYGVSQSLPIFVELLVREEGTAFAIQQPEVHLHPRAQACLGDVFFEMALRDHKTFLVETHSDFAIDRFRMNYRRKRSAKERRSLPNSQILFFERRDSRNTVTPIKIGNNGELPSKQPESYRRFFVKEEMSLLGL